MPNKREHIKEISITKPLRLAGQSLDLAAILQDKGWHLLGHGVEAAVAAHPNKPYVLKIFPNNSVYADFVSFASQHSNSPYVPKFGRLSRPIPGTKWMYVRMEKLEPISEDNLLDHYINYLIALLALGERTGENTLVDDVKQAVEDRIYDWGFDQPDLENPNTLDLIYQKAGGKPPQDWIELINHMSNYNNKHLLLPDWDLHAGNFMLRGNTLVIADPWVVWKY